MRRIAFFAAAVCAATLLAGCAGTPKQDDPHAGMILVPVTRQEVLAHDGRTLSAGQGTGIPFFIPEGTESISVQAASNGNRVSFCIVDSENWGAIQSGGRWNYVEGTMESQSMSYSALLNVHSSVIGTYYLYVKDDTLGILSHSSQTITYSIVRTYEEDVWMSEAEAYYYGY